MDAVGLGVLDIGLTVAFDIEGLLAVVRQAGRRGCGAAPAPRPGA